MVIHGWWLGVPWRNGPISDGFRSFKGIFGQELLDLQVNCHVKSADVSRKFSGKPIRCKIEILKSSLLLVKSQISVHCIPMIFCHTQRQSCKSHRSPYISPSIYPLYNHYIYILPITHWVLLRILAVRKSRGEGSKASLQIRRFSPQPDAASWFPNFWRVSPSKYRDICLGDSKYSVSLFGKYFRSMVIVFKKYIVDQHYMICAFGFLSRKFRINQDVLP